MKNLLFIASWVALIVTTNISAQDAVKPQFQKNPVTVAISDQAGSPLHITFMNVDTSEVQRQRINLTVQNVSQRSIRGYVLSIGEDVGIGSNTDFFTKPFVSGAFHDEQIVIEGPNITSEQGKLTITVDYVEFTDRTVWGDDKHKMSESVSGQTSGARAAAADVSALVRGGEVTALQKLLSKPSADTAVPAPTDAGKRSERWLRGFNSGYRALLYSLHRVYGQTDFAARLEEVRKNLE